MITGEIENIAFGGNGILKDNGLVIFVPFTAPKDKVIVNTTKRKKNYAFGSLISLQASGPDRIEADCPYFRSCGGCQFQHLNYSAQLAAKQRFIEDALHKIAKLPIAVPPIVPAPHQWNYRSHITLRLKPHLSHFRAGYTGSDHFSFLPIKKCLIFCPPDDPILEHVHEILSELSNQHIQEATLRIFKFDQAYSLAFTFSPHPPNNISICEKALKLYPHIQSIFVKSPSRQLTFGPSTCDTRFLNIDASFSPYGFLQNYPDQCETIYKAILNDLPDTITKVLDLYCGIGITSLLFSKKCEQVIGIESHSENIHIAKKNAEKNNISNVIFYHKKVEDLVPQLLVTFKPESILCNPPRNGLDPLLIEAFIQNRIPYVQYLSCMPSTLARDLQRFTAGGYVIENIQGFDLFPQTTHVETLVLLRFKNSPYALRTV